MKSDLIIVWPRNNDYPLWRQFIRDNRTRFNLVIIVFTETNQGEDYRQFVRDAMASDYTLFIENRPITGTQDWRDVGVNGALIQSYNSDWLWFTEQDFIITDEVKFWGYVDQAEKDGFEVIAVKDADRMHPCCMFVKRTALDKTSKNFAASPPAHDHFGQIQKDIEAQNIKTFIIPDGYFHLNGLSHNMTLLYNGEQPNYYPEIFKDWLVQSGNVDVPQSEMFIALMRKAGLR